MPNQPEEEAYLHFVHLNIKELEERAKALESLIMSMATSGQNTKNQSELLFNMLRTIKIAKTFYADSLNNLMADPAERRVRPRKD